jgi:hypothetical protein
MSQATGSAASVRASPQAAGTRTSSGDAVEQVFFRDAPYIGPLVRNALEASKDRVVMEATPQGIRILHGEKFYVVPYSNVKNYVLA